MRHPILMIAVVAAVAGGLSESALAAETGSNFGQHVAECAHQLGQRENAPAVTCTHDGTTMTFSNFGAMVQHMR